MHLLGRPFVVGDDRRLTLRSDGAVLDAQGFCRHFLVQDGGTLELEGVRLLNGRSTAAGGAILGRRGATVRLRNAEVENCTVVGDISSEGRAQGGAIAITGDELETKLVELASGSGGHTDRIFSLAFSPDGSLIVTGSSDATIRLWEVSSLASGPIGQAPSGGDQVSPATSVAFSPDGSRILSTCVNTVKLWAAADLSSGPLGTWNDFQGQVTGGVAFSPDGSLFVTGSSTTMLWNASNASSGRLREFDMLGLPIWSSTLEEEVTSVAFSPNGTQIVSLLRWRYAREEGDHTVAIVLWDATNYSIHHDAVLWYKTDLCVEETNPSGGRGGRVAFSPDGNSVVAGCAHEVKVWDLTRSGDERTVTGSQTGGYSAIDFVTAVAFSPDGNRIFCAGLDSVLRVLAFDAENQLIEAASALHENPVLSLVVSPDGRLIATASSPAPTTDADPADIAVKLFDAADATADAMRGSRTSFAEPSGIGVGAVAFSPDGSHIVTGSDGANGIDQNNWIRLVDATELDIPTKLEETAAIRGVPLTSGRETTTHAEHARTRALRTGKAPLDDVLPLQDFLGITSLRFSPDGRRIVSGSRDTTVTLWDAANLSSGPLATGRGHDADVTSVAFSPDGTRIASGSYDFKVMLWDAADLSSGPLMTGIAHEVPVKGVAFSPDGRRIASISTNMDYFTNEPFSGSKKSGSLMVWDANDLEGGPLSNASGSVGGFYAVAFAPDGSCIATGAYDGTLSVWDANDLASGSLATVPAHSFDVNSLDFSHDGSRIVSVSIDGSMKVWRTTDLAQANPHPAATFHDPAIGFSSVAFSPDGSRIVGGSLYGHLKGAYVWKRHTYENHLVLDAVNISSCRASSHRSGVGGAVSASSGIRHAWKVVATSSSFVSNGAFSSGDNAQGGAVSLVGRTGFVNAHSATFDRCDFSGGNAVSRGGALAAEDCRFELRGCTIMASRARTGSALYYGGTPTTPLSTVEATSFLANSPDPVVQSDALINWICFPGQYMLQVGAVSGSFTGCLPCSGGYFGTAPNYSSPLCEDACSAGHFCPEGSTEPLPCPSGRYLSARGAATNNSCIPCASGSYSKETGNAGRCNACEAGRFSTAEGSTACELCDAGGYCDEPGASSASVFQQCEPGTWSDAIGLNSSAGCNSCDVGKYQPTNGASSSSACNECRRGTAGATAGLAICPDCAAGKYQNETGRTACIDCTAGSFCVEGSSAPLPCPAGTHANSSLGVMTSAGQCVECDAGTFCTVGSAAPTACAPGTVQPEPRQGACVGCDAGKFMNESGRTECHACAPGAYCATGASAALPCPPGTHSNTSGLSSSAQCDECPAGHFCFAGATSATACSKGTYAASTRSQLCTACPAGTYQNVEGATACVSCDPGYTCGVGSAEQVPTMCSAGTFFNATLDTCVDCPAGSWCAGGPPESRPRPCSRGMYANETSSKSCFNCPAGTYQDDAGATGCTVCDPGHECDEGSVVQVPATCIAGTYYNLTLGTCVGCPAGFYCIGGLPDTQPEPCSRGGYCGANVSAPTDCPAGRYGSETGLSDKACSGECARGFFCSAGSLSAKAEACPPGSYSGEYGNKNISSCRPCPPGHACPQGATAPTACAAGSVSPSESAAECSPCANGTFQGDTGKLVCEVCSAGGFCPAGAVAPTLCAEGSYSDQTGQWMASQCLPCRDGHACGVGASLEKACAAGTVANSTGMAACVPCIAGTYQSGSGETACRTCPRGSHCAEGASAALPCAEGSYGAEEGLASNDECTPCPPGSACTTGAMQPKPCNPGSAANASGLGSCVPCSPGEYQDATNATSCELCSVASYCAGEGSSAPTPCPGGTWSGAIGLKAEAQCTKVVKGQWAPTGSAAPKLCPASGFYCPGYDAVQEHLAQNITPPGSEPILIDSGAARQTRNVTVVSFGLTLDADISSYDAAATRAKLAALYNVPSSSISLTVVSGSLELRVTIEPLSEAEDAVAVLSSTVASMGTAELTAALDVSVSVVTSTVMEQVEREYEATCPKGSWCSAGNTIACPVNTYNNETDRIDQGACRACPDNAVAMEGSVALADCRCKAGHFNRLIGSVECSQCPVGSDCTEDGIDLASLPLRVGYYRTSNVSEDLRRCTDFGNSSGCSGGVGNDGPCKPWLTGPYCKLCNVTDTSRYYDAEVSECLPCEGSAAMPLVLGVVAVLSAVTIVLLWLRFKPHRRIGWLVQSSRWLERLYTQLSLRAKGKLLLGFYQVATRVANVYDVPMPTAVARLLSIFEVFNFNIGGIGLPMQCLSLGTYEQRLAFTMLAPVALAAALVACFILRSCCCGSKGDRSRLGAGLLAALPSLLSLTFLVFPMVSSAAFRAFSCEAFDDGRSYLRADYAVECGTDVHARAELLAWIGIGLYPIGISVLYAGLMWRARHAIRRNKPTALSMALGFLVRDYEPTFFWWELIEAWKKLFLVGFAVLIDPGSVVQLVVAFLFSLVYMLLASVAQPFKEDSDDLFAKASGFCLTALFFFSVILKQSVLTEAVDNVLSQQLRSRFSFDAGLVTIGMIASIVGALVIASVMAVKQLIEAARVPVMKLQATKMPPELSLADGGIWHLFLSHIWGTGQDQCATIKRQLTMLLLGVRIFLDVDDLKDIAALETYVDQTAVIMIFVSKGYFKSKNCLREARCTVAKQKPIALVHDSASYLKSFMTVEAIKADECPPELLGPIFDGREVIEWHRIIDFQSVSLKLLAQEVLRGCPYPPEAPRIFIEGELSMQKRAFRSRPRLYTSPNNPGARAVAEDLRRGMHGAIDLVADASGMNGATHFMLYLNDQTYLEDAGMKLADELRAVRADGGAVRVVMVHENDSARGGCDFGILFDGRTPQDLMQGGIYSDLALALYSGPFFPVSVALVAGVLGAGEARLGGANFCTASAARSPLQGDAEAPVAQEPTREVGRAAVEPNSELPTVTTSAMPGHDVSAPSPEEVVEAEAARVHIEIAQDDAAASAAQGASGDGTRPRLPEHVRRAFANFDSDGDGVMDANEMRHCLRSLGLMVDNDEAIEVLRKYDSDASGSIDINEFVGVVLDLEHLKDRYHGSIDGASRPKAGTAMSLPQPKVTAAPSDAGPSYAELEA